MWWWSAQPTPSASVRLEFNAAGKATKRVKDGDHGDLRTTCRAFNDDLRRTDPIDLAADECTEATIMARLQAITDIGLREQLQRRYIDAIDAAAIETCTAYNTAGAGPRIEGLPMSCAHAPLTAADLQTLEAKVTQPATNQLGRARTKPADEDCNLTPKACWEKLLADNVKKARKAFCETLNTDTNLFGMVSIRGGETTCSLDTLLEKDQEYEERVRAAQQKGGPPPPPARFRTAADGTRRPVQSWYEEGLRDIKLAPSYFGIKASVKSDSFKYAPGSIIKDDDIKEETKQGLEVGLTYGILHMATDTYLGITGSIERAYKGGKAKQLCETLNTTQTICRTIATEAPTQKDTEVVIIEARRLIGENFAINPRVQYDLDGEVFGIDLLAYIFRSAAKGLNGGIHITYRDNEDDMGLAVFIGAPFRLFGD